jgi:tetratricopeptide (TPR) repeat protein
MESRRKVDEHAGTLIREAREAQQLTPAEVGEPEFCGHFVKSVEKGAYSPSPQALALLAHRLGIREERLMEAALTKAPRKIDVRSLEEDLLYRLDYAISLARKGIPDDALALATRVEADMEPHAEYLGVTLRYRIPYIRANIYLHKTDHAAAEVELRKALTICPANEEAQARIHNKLGVSLHQQGRHGEALEHLLQALRSVQNGQVCDVSLSLRICRNLGNTYRILGDITAARRFYKQALALSDEASADEHKASILYGLALCCLDERDFVHCKLYSLRALSIYENNPHKNLHVTTSIILNLARALIDEERYDEARVYLARAEVELTTVECHIPRSSMHEVYAHLWRKLGELEQAAASIREGLAASREAYGCTHAIRWASQAVAARNHAQQLGLAAQIEEARGNKDEADALYRDALDWGRNSGYMALVATTTVSYAEALRARGDHARAVEYFSQAADLRPRTAE